MMNDHVSWIMPFTDALIQLNIRATVLSVIVGLICLLCRNWMAARWRSVLWMLVFLAFIVPFGPKSPLSIANFLVPNQSQYPGAAPAGDAANSETLPPSRDFILPAAHVGNARADAVKATSIAVSRFSARSSALAIWLIVAAGLSGRLCLLRVVLERQIRNLSPVKDQDIISQAAKASQEVGRRRLPKLLWTESNTSPAVVGWWSPVLLLPRNSLVLQSNTLRAVLLHELRHVKSGDTLLTWLPHAVCSLFWFNPLLWFARHKWHEDREMACDDWVLQHIGLDNKQHYLESLLAVAVECQQPSVLVFSASIVSSSPLLERRIVAMKKFRTPTWAGVVGSTLLVALTATVGLTDRVHAENSAPAAPAVSAKAEAVTENAKAVAWSKPANNKDDAASKGQKTETLHPVIVFAKHVILWGRTEVVSAHQLKQRLTQLRKKQTVKPYLYHSLGFTYAKREDGDSVEEATAKVNEALSSSMDLVGKNQWGRMSFLSRRGSATFDRIESPEDLIPNHESKLTGRVVLPGTTTPAIGAQVVILPQGEPGDIKIRNGKLANPIQEFWSATDDRGFFQSYPDQLKYDPVLLWGDGEYRTVILHEEGYLVINGQLATSGATYELVPWQEVRIDTHHLKAGQKVLIWVRPQEAIEPFPAFEFQSMQHSDKPLVVKLVPGKGVAAYFDAWLNDSKFRHNVVIESGGFGASKMPEIILPELPAGHNE